MGGRARARGRGLGALYLQSSKTSSLVAQRLKRLPGMRETGLNPWVGKIPWRRKTTTHSSTLAWRIHGGRSLVGYSPRGRKELDTTERLYLLTYLRPLQRGQEHPPPSLSPPKTFRNRDAGTGEQMPQDLQEQSRTRASLDHKGDAHTVCCVCRANQGPGSLRA